MAVCDTNGVVVALVVAVAVAVAVAVSLPVWDGEATWVGVAEGRTGCAMSSTACLRLPLASYW